MVGKLNNHFLNILASAVIASHSIGVQAQETGQLASDILGMTDLWGNPTFLGWAAHGGANSHSLA